MSIPDSKDHESSPAKSKSMYTTVDYDQVLADFQKLNSLYWDTVRKNNALAKKGKPLLPVPVKPVRPLAPFAYSDNGKTHQGRLDNPDDCPVGMTVKWEPLQYFVSALNSTNCKGQ